MDVLGGGCYVSKAAPSGKACHCEKAGNDYTCKGTVVECLMGTSFCFNPDTSPASCVLGGGDCDGYTDRCNCEYAHGPSGGCKIKTKAPPNTACFCDYIGAWTCVGKVVMCENPMDDRCANPGTDENYCKMGQGNCGGY